MAASLFYDSRKDKSHLLWLICCIERLPIIESSGYELLECNQCYSQWGEYCRRSHWNHEKNKCIFDCNADAFMGSTSKSAYAYESSLNDVLSLRYDVTIKMHLFLIGRRFFLVLFFGFFAGCPKTIAEPDETNEDNERWEKEQLEAPPKSMIWAWIICDKILPSAVHFQQNDDNFGFG